MPSFFLCWIYPKLSLWELTATWLPYQVLSPALYKLNVGDESETVAPIIWLYQSVDARKEEVFFQDLLITLQRHGSKYIFIIVLIPGFSILHKDNCKPRREAFKFCDFVRLILDILFNTERPRVSVYDKM